MELTKAQLHALDILWNRDIAEVASNLEYEREHDTKLSPQLTQRTWLTKEEMLASVQPGPGCIMIAWAGMWLGIEPDGHTHS